jgi:hypothetical protein
VVDDAHITPLLRGEKGKKARNTGQRYVRRIAVREVPKIVPVLAGYFQRSVTLGRRKRR